MPALQGHPFLSPCSISYPKTFESRINSLKSFMDLTPESKPEKLSIDIQYHDPNKPKRSQPEYDAAVIGCGPSGLRIAEQASSLGVRVCCIDPDPLIGWPNNYGSWVDEFEELGLADCFDYTWPLTSVAIDEATWKDLSRPYGRVSRAKLKRKLMEGCAENGVRFCKGKVWNVEHEMGAKAKNVLKKSLNKAALKGLTHLLISLLFSQFGKIKRLKDGKEQKEADWYVVDIGVKEKC